MSYLEFEGMVGRFRRTVGRADMRDSAVRAQENFDRAVGMQRSLGAERVTLKVEGTNVDYTIVPRGYQNGLTEQGKNGSTKRSLTREVGQKKPRKTHDLRGLTGFYRGTFYENGVVRSKRNRR